MSGPRRAARRGGVLGLLLVVMEGSAAGVLPYSRGSGAPET